MRIGEKAWILGSVEAGAGDGARARVGAGVGAGVVAGGEDWALGRAWAGARGPAKASRGSQGGVWGWDEGVGGITACTGT